MSLVVYSDGEEVLITTPEFEEEFIQEWFHLGNRRLADRRCRLVAQDARLSIWKTRVRIPPAAPVTL